MPNFCQCWGALCLLPHMTYDVTQLKHEINDVKTTSASLTTAKNHLY